MNHPNILLIAIDSLRADHMSCYGYHRLTAPHISRFAEQGVLFEQTYSPHVPTTPAYASMLTGLDCFGTGVVALRHKGDLAPNVRTLAEILRDAGYTSTCVGFPGNVSGRGFDNYLEYTSWGSWQDRPLRKAGELNNVTLPELDRLNAGDQPWFMMLRHMDPHSPYMPPAPYNSMFYPGDPTDKALPDSAKPMFDFAPFADYFRSWMVPGLRDIAWVDAQYDGAVAYMDACLGVIFHKLEQLGIMDDTIVVLNGDHGEILQEHECWFDHHGMYDPNLHVPLVIRYPSKLGQNRRIPGYNQHKDLVPTLLELADVQTEDAFDGQSLMPLIRGEAASYQSEFYITECTWMRKHGWRTPHWKLIEALEPDFHFMPAVELYNLAEDPLERQNVAEQHPDIVQTLRARMTRFIAEREQTTGITNPMQTQGDWSDAGAPFESSEQAYDQLHIGDPTAARKLQADEQEGEQTSNDEHAAPTPLRRPRSLENAFDERVVTVIGRGHSGTRAMSHTLAFSGVFMGHPQNESGDLIPPTDMYEACRIMARHVEYLGDFRWDFSKLHTMPIDPAFERLLGSYLASVIDSNADWRGWKIPETTLCYPWIVRLFPDIRYIHWTRDPRDTILGGHVTDDLREFGVSVPEAQDPLEQRAISWLYQSQLMRDTPPAKHMIDVRFEDFVLDQDATLQRLSDFLGFNLEKIAVKSEAVGRWKTHPDYREIAFLQPELERLDHAEPSMENSG